jgi:hypothetical protein
MGMVSLRRLYELALYFWFEHLMVAFCQYLKCAGGVSSGDARGCVVMVMVLAGKDEHRRVAVVVIRVRVVLWVLLVFVSLVPALDQVSMG